MTYEEEMKIREKELDQEVKQVKEKLKDLNNLHEIAECMNKLNAFLLGSIFGPLSSKCDSLGYIFVPELKPSLFVKDNFPFHPLYMSKDKSEILGIYHFGKETHEYRVVPNTSEFFYTNAESEKSEKEINKVCETQTDKSTMKKPQPKIKEIIKLDKDGDGQYALMISETGEVYRYHQYFVGDACRPHLNLKYEIEKLEFPIEN